MNILRVNISQFYSIYRGGEFLHIFIFIPYFISNYEFVSQFIFKLMFNIMKYFKQCLMIIKSLY